MGIKTGPKPRPAIDRVLDRVTQDDRGYLTPCWIFTGPWHRSGYGVVGKGGHGSGMIATHIVTYRNAFGDVPEGLELDHLCRVRECCNPAHLEAVTHRENCVRGNGFSSSGRADCCKIGHPLAGSNLIIRSNGRRRCRMCDNRQQREGRLRREQAKRELGSSPGS